MRTVVDIPTPYEASETDRLVQTIDRLNEFDTKNVLVNRMYLMLKPEWKIGQFTIRPGFKFEFVFKHPEDAKQFAKDFGGQIVRIVED